ncbi:MAG: hypothetical protein JW832_03760, partial [Deltaproteobacteria bacterium]|nr:hypothetical protein [Deltaproteobacteria bacterium]
MLRIANIRKKAGAMSTVRHGRYCRCRACALIVLAALVMGISGSCLLREKVGVLFVVHGGFDHYTQQAVWDAGVQQFSYDPNHPVYKQVIWNAAWWSMVLQVETSLMYTLKYDFEYPRIGGTDPFGAITMQQMDAMEQALDRNARFSFAYDWAGWMSGDDVAHYPYPRYIYNPPSGTG